MPKMTDYVREGFRRRQRPWDRTELPEWWDVAVWTAAVGVIAVLVFSAAAGRGGSSGTAAQNDRGASYAVQTLGPQTPAASTALGVPAAPAEPTPTDSAPVGFHDFSASAAVRVPVTGGGTTVVPAGARNVALAAARAATTGDWRGIPLVGKARPPAAQAPTRSLLGQFTVADPAVTGNSRYEFSATFQEAGTAQRSVVQIVVERATSGYAIRSV
jgi:hypothetical protein